MYFIKLEFECPISKFQVPSFRSGNNPFKNALFTRVKKFLILQSTLLELPKKLNSEIQIPIYWNSEADIDPPTKVEIYVLSPEFRKLNRRSTWLHFLPEVEKVCANPAGKCPQNRTPPMKGGRAASHPPCLSAGQADPCTTATAISTTTTRSATAPPISTTVRGAKWWEAGDRMTTWMWSEKSRFRREGPDPGF